MKIQENNSRLYEKKMIEIINRVRRCDLSNSKDDLLTLASFFFNGKNKDAEEARIKAIKHFVNDNEKLNIKSI